ncbi:MAG: GNAT family N-acetyltransferase [Terriglobales bacterium]
MRVELKVISGAADAGALEREWEELLCACPRATVFDSLGWARANLRAFPNHDSWILTFREPDSYLVGVIPLVARRGRRYLRERRWMEFAGQPYADYASCPVRPGWEAAVAERLAEFCRSKADDWDGVYLDRLSADSAFLACISSAMKKGGLLANVREAGKIRLLNAQEHEANADGKERTGRSLRKARTRMAEQGELTFDVFTQRGAIADRLERFFDWHVARFAARGLRSPLADASHREFYRQIVDELAPKERIWLSVLACGARPVAMRFSPVFNGTVHLYSTCFDAAFAKCSPSMVHLEMLLEHAFRSGMRCVDFGLGESPQKEFAGSGSQTVSAVEVYSSRTALLEQRCYHAAERLRSRLPVAARLGKLLRRAFPYDVR